MYIYSLQSLDLLSTIGICSCMERARIYDSAYNMYMHGSVTVWISFIVLHKCSLHGSATAWIHHWMDLQYTAWI